MPILCLLTACATTSARPRFADADYPGVLRAPEALGFDVVWQQRVTAFWGEGQQRGFDAAIQKQGDKLTVIGLSPTGAIGFSIVMHGDAIEVQNHMAEELPFPARFILLDVQRAFYPWLRGEFRDTGADVVRSDRVDDERVSEEWRGGRLVERRFRRDDEPDGEIVVRYEWADGSWRGPARAELDNGWFGYRLQVDTHAETLLPTPAGAGR